MCDTAMLNQIQEFAVFFETISKEKMQKFRKLNFRRSSFILFRHKYYLSWLIGVNSICMFCFFPSLRPHLIVYNWFSWWYAICIARVILSKTRHRLFNSKMSFVRSKIIAPITTLARPATRTYMDGPGGRMANNNWKTMQVIQDS